jgi:predicted DNA binding CopG/RHH family protein
MSSDSNKKTFPSFRTDEEAERFVETADLSQYDFAGFEPTTFEFARKDAQINMRIPEALLDAVKSRAREKGLPFTRYIRLLMEQDVARR